MGSRLLHLVAIVPRRDARRRTAAFELGQAPQRLLLQRPRLLHNLRFPLAFDVRDAGVQGIDQLVQVALQKSGGC
jgi:hypothetical protein